MVSRNKAARSAANPASWRSAGGTRSSVVQVHSPRNAPSRAGLRGSARTEGVGRDGSPGCGPGTILRQESILRREHPRSQSGGHRLLTFSFLIITGEQSQRFYRDRPIYSEPIGLTQTSPCLHGVTGRSEGVNMEPAATKGG